MTGQRCEVVAGRLDDAGHGVGTAAGLRLHVVDLLPGEGAEVAIDHRSPHKAEAWGHVVRRLGAVSPARVEPACPAFGRCGGCPWQHLDYRSQLAEKQARVERALAGVAMRDGGRLVVAPPRSSPMTLGYRNKGKYVVGRAGDHLVLGAYAPRSHHVIDTLGCRVVAPVIDEVATWVRGAAEQAALIAFDERTRVGELRYVLVREAGGDVLIALIVASGTSRDKLQRVADAMRKHPAVAGVLAIENDRRDGAIVPSGSPARVLSGHGHLVEQVAGVDVEVGAGEFLQINREQAASMYARVAELAEVGPTTRAVDLFAGLGGIGLTLAAAGARVVAIEIDEDAVAQLRRAAQQANLAVTAIAADAGRIPAAVREQIEDDPDVVVVNPPRKGLGGGARDLVLALRPRTLIYVSCGPDALGRDLVELARHGYAPDVIEPFDLMPGTPQIETLVRLRRDLAPAFNDRSGP